MSKFSSKNKLIEKQLKQLNKKEEKLILEKEPGIIKNKLDPLKIKIEEKIPEKLQSTLNIAFEMGFKTVFDKGLGIIEKTYNKDNISMEFDINSYAINKYPTKRNLKKIDKSANKKTLIKRHYLSYAIQKQKLKISLRKDKNYYQKISEKIFKKVLHNKKSNVIIK